MVNPVLAKIFDALESSVLAEGGDGDGACICPNSREIADKFENWLKEKNCKWWHREDRPDCVVFSNNQEYIFITDNDNDSYNYIVKLKFPCIYSDI